MIRDERNIDEILKQHLPSAPIDAMEADSARVLRELRSGEPLRERIPQEPPISMFPWQRVAVLCAAAAAVVVIAIVSTRQSPKTDIQQLQIGETVRSEKGTQVSLLDGSRIEMGLQSELSLERADDGVRIRLNRGGIIVNAAKQRTGHLYVQTRDVTVSVVGTVFLVHAEEKGSRVAVIQGEVQVQQGATAQTLLPGQQVATNPIMPKLPVIEEISWSRNAAAHLALLQASLATLQQSINVPLPPPAALPQEAFEVVSIRQSAPLPAGGRGGGNSNPGRGCNGLVSVQMDPNRFTATMPLYSLIALAYGKECIPTAQHNLISGGPEWLKSDLFAIQAILPAGSPVYTKRQFMDADVPRLQAMIRTMLADRFKLEVHREMKELPVYVLSVAKAGSKLTPFQEGSCDPEPPAPGQFVRIPAPPGQKKPCSRILGMRRAGNMMLIANGVTVESFARLLSLAFDRPVIDRTGIAGRFEFLLEASTEGLTLPPPPPTPDGTPVVPEPAPSIFSAIQDQLGLKLDPTRGPVEVLVIDHAEKPTEN